MTAALTHVLCHAHLHVLLLEVLHGLEGLLRIHLLVHRLHCLDNTQTHKSYNTNTTTLYCTDNTQLPEHVHTLSTQRDPLLSVCWHSLGLVSLRSLKYPNELHTLPLIRCHLHIVPKLFESVPVSRGFSAAAYWCVSVQRGWFGVFGEKFVLSPPQ